MPAGCFTVWRTFISDHFQQLCFSIYSILTYYSVSCSILNPIKFLFQRLNKNCYYSFILFINLLVDEQYSNRNTDLKKCRFNFPPYKFSSNKQILVKCVSSSAASEEMCLQKCTRIYLGLKSNLLKSQFYCHIAYEYFCGSILTFNGQR